MRNKYITNIFSNELDYYFSNLKKYIKIAIYIFKAYIKEKS